MDPLAELVKIDPKSLGVGQYQHDVNQTWLQNSLQEVVESCVNNVGVEINSSSTELLSYVSGIGPNLANNIIEYRNENGPFQSRDDFAKIPRFGPKTFEQAAGFLRIHGAENPLDYSAVHPESYEIVEAMASHLNSSVQELMAQETLQKQIKIEQFVTDKVGIPTLKDIMKELPNRAETQREIEQFEFDPNINSIQDLVIGMVLPGIVTNITNFGCFVDVGVHQDGLVHVSQMANRYISDPNDVVKLRDQVMVKVVDVDLDRKRISLSMKDLS